MALFECGKSQKDIDDAYNAGLAVKKAVTVTTRYDTSIIIKYNGKTYYDGTLKAGNSTTVKI